MESFVRRFELDGDTRLFNHLVPTSHACDGIFDVVVAQHFIERIEHRHFFVDQLPAYRLQDMVALTAQLMIVGALAFFVAAFEAGAVEGSGIR